MKKFLVLLTLFLIFSPTVNLHAQSNAGFVPGNIWYSIDPFQEGDKIKIYTVLFNPDIREFSGTVIFFNKTTFLGKKDFAIVGRGVKDISIDWTVTAGDHIIFAKIENAKFLISSGKYEDVYLSGNQTEESKRSVSKKITPKSSTSEKTDTTPSIAVPNISKIIEEKTPNIISTPVIATAEAIEGIREKIGSSSKEGVTNTKESLSAQGQTKEKTSTIIKPFKYIKLFFLSVISFVFNNKFIFYGLNLIIVFLFLRYLWHKIF